ncbi:hypothetical protein AMEX_G10246 [Astyanax mexicanus]|uniref:Exonuclease domain-containing protein n=1 Tax=Astyanax mexicanus TaxID=7994 RepID=A0A8T2M259_ASTMX|nr:hypothetical protein AMEX_G10246 [Astyanax mexicanus]
MFPSAALLADIACPLFSGGCCERPYCLYKHTKEDSSGLAEAATGHGALHNQEESNTCLLELEKINKQIEAVRNEVEKEQKRLFRYQSEQTEITRASADTAEQYVKSKPTVSKDLNGNRVKSKKTAAAPHSHPSAQKYVVDRSRPKTDLEYDPCSNFSSDLRSSSSKDKNKSTSKMEVEIHQRAKGKGKNVVADPDPVHLPSCSLKDSDDEGTLIIDVPPQENNRKNSRPQKWSMVTSEGGTSMEKELGSRRLSRKCNDIKKITEEPSETECLEVASLDKDGVKLRSTKENTSRTVLDSPERNLVIDIPHQLTNDCNKPVKPKLSRLQREEVSSGGIPHLEIGPSEDKKKPLNQCKSMVQEASGTPSTKRLVGKGLENDQKSFNQSSTNAKNGKTKEENSKQAISPMVEKKNAGHSSKANILEHLPANSLPPGGHEEKAQTIENGNALDNISLCLDHLRSESENITCFPMVEDFILDNIPSTANSSKVGVDPFSQPTKHGVQGLNVGRTELEVKQNCLSGSVQKADPLPLKYHQVQQVSQEMVFQDYFPSTTPFPSMIKEPVAGQKSLTPVEACWLPPQNVLPQPVVQNTPAYISGPDPACAPSTQSVKLHNPAAASSVNLASIPIQKKPPSTVTSGITAGITCGTGGPAQTSSPALMAAANQVIEIGSSSSEELNYSDLDLSDTDPMEECYRIFMEANGAENPTAQDGVPEEVPKMAETEASANPPPVQKKRVAHVAKFEQVSKSKAQVIVPLRDGGSQLPVPTRSQQCQKRAAALTAAVKGCQQVIAASVPRKVFAPTIIQPSPIQSAYVNILPVGTTLRLGSNLHLIVPDGNCALPVTLIPATLPVTRPLHQPAQNLQPAQPANYTPAKSIPTKRKAKVRDVGVKVPHDVRQRYVNLFVEEFLKTSATVQDAFEKALAEEKTVFDRSINKLKYLSVAVNALKRLKNQNAAPAKFSSERDAQASRGNVPLNTQALLGNGDLALYDQLKEHILTEAMLRENNYPRRHPDKAGAAVQYGGEAKKGAGDGSRRICCRCGTSFSVSQTGKHTRKEECNYHYGKVIENRVPGGVETRYSCCENAVGAPGCQVFKLHVHDAVSLQSFVSSLPQTCTECPGIYSIDTVMCYTTQGLELVRVTVVNSSLQVIYDTFVQPNNEVIDYNTRFSGVSEDDVKGSSSSLRDVQAVLLSFISADTILVGHGLENDLCALKLLHSTVVDTSVVFPHRLGPPHKRELHSLTAEYLRRIIQESAEGHDSSEDAVACMELMLWKVKEDAKGKRW